MTNVKCEECSIEVLAVDSMNIEGLTVCDECFLWLSGETGEWFTADQLLPKVMEELPQKTMSVNVYAVSRFLRIMEARGQIIARKNGYGVKEFSKIEGEDDGRSHFYA